MRQTLRSIVCRQHSTHLFAEARVPLRQVCVHALNVGGALRHRLGHLQLSEVPSLTIATGTSTTTLHASWQPAVFAFARTTPRLAAAVRPARRREPWPGTVNAASVTTSLLSASMSNATPAATDGASDAVTISSYCAEMRPSSCTFI